MDTRKFQEVESILAHFVPPEKLCRNTLLIYDGEGDNRIYTLHPIADSDEIVMKIAVRDLDRDQQGVISRGASEIISKYHEKDVRYPLHPLQRSYDLVHASGKEGKRFKKHIMATGCIHNLERLRKPNLLFPDSYDYVIGDSFIYEGEPIEVEIDDKVLNTLVRGGAFKTPQQKVFDWGIESDKNGESFVSSAWDSAKGCFSAGSTWPLYSSKVGVAVFGKTDKRVSVEMVTVPKRAYEMDVAARRAEQRELRDLKDKLAATRNALA